MPSPFSYKGYYTDGETGLFYLNARYYDPSIQQFTQEDTYWGDGTNLYGYCGANPVMYFDPSGHTKRDILSGFINALDDNLFASSARCILYLLKKIDTHDSYDDAYDYYLGRTAGDIVSMAISAGLTVSGIMTIVGSITGGAALTIGSGGTLIIGGAAVSVQGVAIGAATAAVGGKISLAAAKNFGKDYSMMKSLKSSRGNKGAGKGVDFKFPKSNNDMKKIFGVNDKVFHKRIKPEIIKQINKDPVYSKEFRKMGNNPDIGVDNVGNVVLKDLKTGKTLQTNWSFKSFIP